MDEAFRWPTLPCCGDEHNAAVVSRRMYFWDDRKINKNVLDKATNQQKVGWRKRL